MTIQDLTNAAEAHARQPCGFNHPVQVDDLESIVVAAYELLTPEQREIFWKLQPVKTCLEEGGYLPRAEQK